MFNISMHSNFLVIAPFSVFVYIKLCTSESI